MPLHPDVKNFLTFLESIPTYCDVSELSVEEARRRSDVFSASYPFPKKLPPIPTRCLSIPSVDGTMLPARHYVGTTDQVMLYFHGGGYVLHHIDDPYDAVMRYFVEKLGVHIVSVDYRLAPEYRMPTQVEDGYSALCWLAENGAAFGIPTEQIILAGDSAGGHLATMVTILSRDRSGPRISAQWLWYPWCDADFSRNSYRRFATGYFLTLASTKWFAEQCLPTDDLLNLNYAFPLKVADLSNLPPAYIIAAENDVLIDEIEVYVERLKVAGNHVTYERAPGMIHAFLTFYQIPAAFAMIQEYVGAFRGFIDLIYP